MVKNFFYKIKKKIERDIIFGFVKKIQLNEYKQNKLWSPIISMRNFYVNKRNKSAKSSRLTLIFSVEPQSLSFVYQIKVLGTIFWIRRGSLNFEEFATR